MVIHYVPLCVGGTISERPCNPNVVNSDIRITRLIESNWSGPKGFYYAGPTVLGFFRARETAPRNTKNTVEIWPARELCCRFSVYLDRRNYEITEEVKYRMNDLFRLEQLCSK